MSENSGRRFHPFWINSFNADNKSMTWEREAERQNLLKTQKPSS